MSDGTGEASQAELLAAVRECSEVWGRTGFPLRVAASHEIRFRVGYPLVAHAVNNVRVAGDVFSRVPHVSAGIARVALEHALAAQWVFWTREGPETLVKHMEAGYLARTRAFRDAVRDQPGLTRLVAQTDLDTLDELSRREPAPGGERGWSMQAIFDRFSDSALFYDMYRELSGAVHPSFATTQAYLEVGREGAPASLSRRGHPRLAYTTAQGLALAGVLALDFLERCQADPPEPSPAARIANRVNLPHDLSASDQHPKRQPDRPG